MEVHRDGRVVGRAVCIAPRMLLTAGHVVGTSAAEDLAVRDGDDGSFVKVIFAKSDPTLDVAVLHVDGDFDVATVRPPSTNENWIVPTPSGLALPDLSGRVTSVRRSWRNALGVNVSAVQLQVGQTLQDFKGYSGAGVMGDDGAAIGILVEQQPVSSSRSRPQGYSNVLYAVSVLAACEALKIEPQRELPPPRAPLPASMSYHEDVLESLRGYRSRLTSQDLRFVEPPNGTDWSPESLWTSLSTQEVGSLLLVGHGGVGKTRTLLEVGDIANNAGWDVIHVRGGNAVRVADTIGERVRAPSAQPVLLLLDYLNLARELDLLALTELANASGTDPKLRILATSRTGWELRHRQDSGMSRFRRVFLTPDDANASAVCLAIVKQIAPTATRRYGAGAVLDVTGSRRPILAVLLGQIVETQVVASGDLPAALVSEDIATWLDDRLLEDDVLPAQESADGAALPPHMLIAAVCLAAAPAPRDELIRSTLAAISSVSRELVAVTLERLQRLGWIIDSTDGLAPAHDVVVDKILEAAVLHRDSGIVRESALTAVLDTALTSPLVFGNAIASLERVLDERATRDLSSSEVRTSATAWLMGAPAKIMAALSEESSAGARVAAQILESELWINGTDERWVSLGSDLLRALEMSPLAAEPLLVACRTLTKDVIPSISDRAVAWITRQGTTADEFVMNACLTRKDVSPEDSELLVAVAIDSLAARSTEVTADFTLRRLLRRSDLTVEDLTVIHADVKIWLEAYGGSEHAVHFLSSVVDNEELRRIDPEMWDHAWDLSLAWIREHPDHIDSALALESLIKTDRAEPLFEETIWPLTAGWLSAQGEEPPAIYVLESLLQLRSLTRFQVEEVLVASSRWIDLNATHKSASFLIKELVIWERDNTSWSNRAWELADKWLTTTGDSVNAAWVLRTALRNRSPDDPMSPRIWIHVRRWLLRHSTLFEARSLLGDALTWGYLEDAASAVLWDCTEKWLSTHISKRQCSHLLPIIYEWPGLDSVSRDRLLQLSANWLAADHPGSAKSFVIQGVVEHVRHNYVDLPTNVWERVEDWLDEFGTTIEASYILRKLLQSAHIVEYHGEALCLRVSTWLEHHPSGNATVRLVRTVLSTTSTRQASNIVTPAISSALERLEPTLDRETCLMLQDIAAWEEVSEFTQTVWAVAGRFLALDNGKFGGYVIQALLTSEHISTAIPDDGWRGARTWLTTHDSERPTIHTLIALLNSPHLTSSQARDLWPPVASWLTAHSRDPKVLLLARTVYMSQHFGPAALAAVWPTIASRFGNLATRRSSRDLLERIALGGYLDETQVSNFWTCASRWLDRFGESHEANFLLQALVKMQSTDVQREILWSHVYRWLTASTKNETSAYLLIELLRWPGLDANRAKLTLDFVRSWLGENGSARKAAGVVGAIVRSRYITHRQLEAFGSVIRAWLASRQGDSASKEFSRVANSRTLSNNRRSIASAILARA